MQKHRKDDASPWEYTIFVGDNFKRHYSDDTLPDFVKERLTMIVASSKTNRRDWEFSQYDVYWPYKILPEGFEEIGWQVSDTYFVVAMSPDQLEELKGN